MDRCTESLIGNLVPNDSVLLAERKMERCPFVGQKLYGSVLFGMLERKGDGIGVETVDLCTSVDTVLEMVVRNVFTPTGRGCS